MFVSFRTQENTLEAEKGRKDCKQYMRIGHIASDAWWEILHPMDIHFADNKSSIQTFNDWLNPHGSFTVHNDINKKPDVIICWGVTQMGNALKAVNKYPDVPLINYQWDIYEWAINTPRPGEYDYRAYVKFLTKSKEIWVPSEAEKARTLRWLKEFEGVDNIPVHVVLSHVPLYDMPTSDEGFVFTSLRANPDRNLGWFNRACEELGIPYVNSSHTMDRETYRRHIATCSFYVSYMHEMSTGGLSTFEAYNLGKPVLMNAAPTHGGKDYLGDRATYFDGTYEDLKTKIRHIWVSRDLRMPDMPAIRAFMKEHYSEEAMAKRIFERLKNL